MDNTSGYGRLGRMKHDDPAVASLLQPLFFLFRSSALNTHSAHAFALTAAEIFTKIDALNIFRTAIAG